MGTKRRGIARSKTSPGRARPGGRISRNRLEKIPIPPIPAFLQSATRAPARKQDPPEDPSLEAIGLNAISDEEADLLLGVPLPEEDDRSRPASGSSRTAGTVSAIGPDLPAGALTEDEADELLGLAPEPAVLPHDQPPAAARPVPPDAPARSGASGAAVLNALVDEIEKDLERDLDRRLPAGQPRRYGLTIGCWVSPLADASHLHSQDAPGTDHEEEESR